MRHDDREKAGFNGRFLNRLQSIVIAQAPVSAGAPSPDAGRTGLKWTLLLNAALAVHYVILGWFGLMLAVPPGYATVVWPASGVAIAFLIFHGIRLAPGVLIGSFAVNCLAGGLFTEAGLPLTSMLAALGIALSSTAQAVFAMLVSRRLFGVPLEFSRLREVAAFALLVGPVSCLIASSGAAATLYALGILSPDMVATNWTAWWFGDLLGISVILPMALFSPWRPWALHWFGAPLAGLRPAAFLALLIPLGVTFYACKLTSESTFARNQVNFAGLAADNERALVFRIESYALGLDGAAGLIEASDEVTIADWRNYVETLDIAEKLPGMNGIGFIEQVPEGGLAALVERYRRLGVTDLDVHPLEAGQDMFVTVYIEPADDNRAAAGLNIAFDENRRTAAIRARDSGRPMITKRVFLVQDATHSAAFLLLRPLYRIGAPVGTVAERRKAFLGWIYAPFIGFKFLQHLSASQGQLVALQVYDGDRADADELIYDGAWAGSVTSEPSYTVTKTIEVYGQNWTLRWSSTPAFEAGVQSSEPILVLAAGILLSGMFAAYLLSLAQREESNRRIVDDKTREIAEREVENRSLVDNAMVGIVLLDEAGRVLSANRAAHDMFCMGNGIDPQEPGSFLKALGFEDVLPGRVLERLSRGSNGDAQTTTVSVHCKNDRELEVDLQMNHWRTEAGADRYTVIARDVSTQNRMRIALEQAEERWAIALAGASIGVFDTDLANKRAIVSDVWRQMVGFGPDEAIDPLKEWEKRLHPEDRARVHATIKACLDGHEVHAKSEYRIRHRDGRWIWLRSDATVIERDANGRAIRFVGTETDITDLRLAEAAHRASEERFRTAIEHAPIGMALLDLEGRWLKVNDAICRFFGYENQDLMQIPLQELTHPEDRDGDQEQLAQLMTGETETYQRENRYVQKSGDIVWGLLSVSLAHDETGHPSYFIAQILDVTHRREVEKLQSEFISTVNHELRTPLTSIQGALGLLKANFSTRASDREKTLLSHSYESAQRLARLVNDILDVEKIAQGKLDYRLEVVDVVGLIGQIAESQAQLAEKWGVRIDTELPGTGIPVLLDPDRFSQALINIMSNAAKFSNGAERIIVRAGQLADGQVRISVQDFGPGIPEAFRAKIFGKFAQADSSSTRKAQGSGLGLNITKSIIEAFGGSVGFESVEGKGSTFFFLLPVELPEARSA